jgi:hypothetical protein
MSMRRFTRLTNAFSKIVENDGNAVALYFAYYNFCRVHQTLRVTPAMEAGLPDHVWSVDELVGPNPYERLKLDYESPALTIELQALQRVTAAAIPDCRGKYGAMQLSGMEHRVAGEF